jgi:hypothetical protein
MEKTKDTPPNKGATAATEPKQTNHTDKIKSQVLAKIGKLPQLHRVEVSKHHNGKYRVNIWQQPEPDKSLAVMPCPRIGLSYYLTVSDTGEIINSDPPMTKVGTSA